MDALMALDAAEIIRTHQAGVWRYLRFLGADEPLADDLTQDVFVALLSRGYEYDGPAKASAYLRAIARNQFINVLRRTKREVALDDLDAREGFFAEIGDDGGDAHRAALDACVEKLPKRSRNVIGVYYGGEHSREEAAAALGMNEEALKKLLWRVRDALRQCIERRLAHA